MHLRPSAPSSLLITVAEAATVLSCSTRLVRRMMADGELDFVRLGRRAKRLRRSDVLALIERGSPQGQRAQPRTEPGRATATNAGHASTIGERP